MANKSVGVAAVWIPTCSRQTDRWAWAVSGHTVSIWTCFAWRKQPSQTSCRDQTSHFLELTLVGCRREEKQFLFWIKSHIYCTSTQCPTSQTDFVLPLIIYHDDLYRWSITAYFYNFGNIISFIAANRAPRICQLKVPVFFFFWLLLQCCCRTLLLFLHD